MPVPAMAALVPLIEQSPEVARYGAVLGQARAQIALERARRVPDPTVRAGAAYFNENGDMGALLGVSIPIPLFDTNRGAIEAASARGEAARAEAEGAYLDAVRSLTVSYGTLTASAEAARALRTQALPDARIAYEGILTGYREGEFDLLAALDAQRALVETQNALLDALADYWQARAEVERLVAAPLDDLR
jgi:cobalt-zinc-cadmium efflux system outer membrane protein